MTQTFVGFYASINVCVKDIGSKASTVIPNYKKIIEMTANMIYIVAFGVGLKCPRKTQLSTQCPPPGSNSVNRSV